MKTSRKFGYALLGALFIGLLIGCTPTNAPTPPLAPGYANPQDQTIGQTLAAMHQFYQTIWQESADGKVTLSPTEKTALNDFGAALNVAQSAYLAYHNGLGSEAQAQAFTNEAQSKQLAVQGLVK